MSTKENDIWAEHLKELNEQISDDDGDGIETYTDHIDAIKRD